MLREERAGRRPNAGGEDDVQRWSGGVRAMEAVVLALPALQPGQVITGLCCLVSFVCIPIPHLLFLLFLLFLFLLLHLLFVFSSLGSILIF